MELRKFRAEDLAPLAKMGMLSFGGSVADWEGYYDPEKNPRMDHEWIHVIEEDGEPRASATVLPLEIYVDGEPVPMGGVAAVKTHPAYRRRGYAGKLMRALLGDLRERGVHLSMLWPFAHSFYRAHGWELAGETIAYTLKPTDLSTSPEQTNIRAYRDEDLPQLMALLEDREKRHSCSVRRTEEAWRKRALTGRESQTAVYDRSGKIDGYMIYRMSDWKEGPESSRDLGVSEMIAATREARDGLVSFLAAQDPSVFGIRHWTSHGEPLHPYLTSSYVKAEVSPEFMLRLVDVEGALGHLHRRIDSPLVLEVSDDVIPENGGEYTVWNGEVLRGAEAEERVSLDVRQFAQLYAGYLPAKRLAEHDLVTPESPRALELLEAFFPVGDPWVSGPDHF